LNIKKQALLDFLTDTPDAYQHEMTEHFGISQIIARKAIKCFGIV